MKYISQRPSGAFDLTEYGLYLEREATVLSQVVHGDDLLRIERFLLGREGLHDARLTGLVLDSKVTGESQGIDHVEVRLRGPYFDRHFVLRYSEVLACTVEAPGSEVDLLVHEIRFENGVLVHEMQFDLSRRIEISCREIRFAERLDNSGESTSEA